MKKVILLGATSNISKYLIPRLLAKNDVELTLFARQATRRLHQYAAQSQVTLTNGNRGSRYRLLGNGAFHHRQSKCCRCDEAKWCRAPNCRRWFRHLR